MDLFEVLLAIVVIAAVAARQLRGEPLRGRRLFLLPVVLLIAGVAVVRNDLAHLSAVDLTCLVLSAALAGGIGAGQGTALRLESREGVLYGRMPPRGLWLWCTLLVSRVVMTVAASGLHAHVAASSAPILLLLGINRLGQAAVVIPRALSTGIPFAPERDGRPFLPERDDRPLTGSQDAWYVHDTTGPQAPGADRPSSPYTPRRASLGDALLDRRAARGSRALARRSRRW